MDLKFTDPAGVEWNRLSALPGLVERNVGVQCRFCLDMIDTSVLVDEAAKAFYLEVPSGFYGDETAGFLTHRCGAEAKLFSYAGTLKGYRCKVVTGNSSM